MLVTKNATEQYFEKIKSPEYDPINNDEILKLIKVAQSGYNKEKKIWFTEEAIKARNEIINRNIRLVPYVVHKIMKGNKVLYSSFIDCISDCNLSLIKCIIGYNLKDNKTHFATYAQIAIRRRAWRYLREHGSSIKLPSNRVNERRIEENKIYCNPGGLDRLFKGDFLSVNPVFSIDAEFEEGNSTQFDFPVEDNPQKKISESEINSLALQSLKCLNDQERAIIQKRYLFDSVYDKKKKDTLKVLSNELKISGERVRQIEEKALKKMRKFITVDNNEER
jgi:RNA polymerase primary sigma factor